MVPNNTNQGKQIAGLHTTREIASSGNNPYRNNGKVDPTAPVRLYLVETNHSELNAKAISKKETRNQRILPNHLFKKKTS